MNFKDNDIKFEKIDWKEFEELCFDLLLKYQFHDLNWRQGGSDKGRDIEAIYTITNPLIGPYSERWFIECKHHAKGIPVSEVSSKIDWAAASKVQHFLLVTNKYISQVTNDFIELRRNQVDFKIHIIDGKMLKQKLLPFPDLIVKYFADDNILLVQNILKQWLFHDILPDVKTLSKLSKIVEPQKLNKEELLFLWFAYTMSNYDEDILDYDMEPFTYDFLIPFIKAEINSDVPITYTLEGGHHEVIQNSMGYKNTKVKGTDINIFVQTIKFHDDFLQILLKRKSKQLLVKIAIERTKKNRQSQ
jgi:hypothetical protein